MSTEGPIPETTERPPRGSTQTAIFVGILLAILAEIVVGTVAFTVINRRS